MSHSDAYEVLQHLGLDHGVVSYNEISARTGLPCSEVELFAINAILEGRISGKIDAANEQVHIYSVAPQAGDAAQHAQIAGSLLAEIEQVVNNNLSLLRASQASHTTQSTHSPSNASVASTASTAEPRKAFPSSS